MLHPLSMNGFWPYITKGITVCSNFLYRSSIVVLTLREGFAINKLVNHLLLTTNFMVFDMS